MPTSHFRRHGDDPCKPARLALAVLAGVCDTATLADCELLLVTLRAVDPIYGRAYEELRAVLGEL